MTSRTMHPLDRLARRIQSEPGTRALDLIVARALYGDHVVHRDGRWMIVRWTRASFHQFEVPRYTATRHQIGRAVALLRKRKAELMERPALRMAA